MLEQGCAAREQRQTAGRRAPTVREAQDRAEEPISQSRWDECDPKRHPASWCCAPTNVAVVECSRTECRSSLSGSEAGCQLQLGWACSCCHGCHGGPNKFTQFHVGCGATLLKRKACCCRCHSAGPASRLCSTTPPYVSPGSKLSQLAACWLQALSRAAKQASCGAPSPLVQLTTACQSCCRSAAWPLPCRLNWPIRVTRASSLRKQNRLHTCHADSVVLKGLCAVEVIKERGILSGGTRDLHQQGGAAAVQRGQAHPKPWRFKRVFAKGILERRTLQRRVARQPVVQWRAAHSSTPAPLLPAVLPCCSAGCRCAR